MDQWVLYTAIDIELEEHILIGDVDARPSPLLTKRARTAKCLKHESHLGLIGARRYGVSAAEGREEVIEGYFVGKVDYRKPQVHLESVGVINVVFAHSKIK